MVSKVNYTSSINGIMECILVTSLKGATHVPTLFLSVGLSMLVSVASTACVVVMVAFYQQQ
jgi:hypothetical protein